MGSGLVSAGGSPWPCCSSQCSPSNSRTPGSPHQAGVAVRVGARPAGLTRGMAAPAGKSRCLSCSRESGICKGRCCKGRRITGWKVGQGMEDVTGELLELGKVAPRGLQEGGSGAAEPPAHSRGTWAVRRRGAVGDEVLELLGKQNRQSRALSSAATSDCSPGPRTGIIPARGECGRVLAPLQDQGTWWPGVAWLGPSTPDGHQAEGLGGTRLGLQGPLPPLQSLQ